MPISSRIRKDCWQLNLFTSKESHPLALPYNVHKIDIGKGDQFSPEFVAINPNSKIPAIRDRDTNIQVFESGAILIYLAEKTGMLLPTEAANRWCL